MNKNIFVIAEDICKSKAFGLVEPLYPRRFEIKLKKILLFVAFDICQRDRFSDGRRRQRQDFYRLRATLRVLNQNLDFDTVGNRRLTKVAQHVGVQKDVLTAFVGDDKAVALRGIKPFDGSVDMPSII